jgi:hypothetical protein
VSAWYTYEVEVDGAVYFVDLSKYGDPQSIQYLVEHKGKRVFRDLWWRGPRYTKPTGIFEQAIDQAQQAHVAACRNLSDLALLTYRKASA